MFWQCIYVHDGQLYSLQFDSTALRIERECYKLINSLVVDVITAAHCKRCNSECKPEKANNNKLKPAPFVNRRRMKFTKKTSFDFLLPTRCNCGVALYNSVVQLLQLKKSTTECRNDCHFLNGHSINRNSSWYSKRVKIEMTLFHVRAQLNFLRTN